MFTLQFHFHDLEIPTRMTPKWCYMTRQTSLPDPVYPVTSLAHGFEFRAFRAEGLVHLGLGASGLGVAVSLGLGFRA